MADKSIKITIATALNAAGFTATKRALSSLISGTKELAVKVGGNLMNIKAAFDMISASAQKFVALMSKGMEFERMTTTFKSLTGSMELAAAHMRDLQDLGRTPPFSLEEFAAASQAMMKMTGGMAGFKAQMEIVGDMAAATGNDIATVGRAFGLAYQVIRDGQDFGRAGQQLYSLGIMTKKQVAEFAELSKAGTDNAAVWEKLQEVFARYKGAMADTEKTTKGVIEAIQGEATVAMTDFSEAITKAATPALQGLLGWLQQINADGTIEEWADRAVSALGVFSNAIKSVYELWRGSLGTVFAFARGADKAFAEGKSFKEQIAAGKETAMRYYNGEDEDPQEAAVMEARKLERAKRKAERIAKAEAEAARRIKEDLSKAQEETDRKKAEAEAAKPKIDLFGGNVSDFAQSYEDEMTEAAKNAAKAELDARREGLRILHDERMAQIDAEQRRIADEIAALRALGADDPMGRAAGMDQGGEIRGRRQKAINASRMADAQARILQRMIDTGATVDDPSKLGRLSNLEQAALERMRLVKKQQEAERLQKERDAREKEMAKHLKEIDDKLKNVGL